MHHHAPIKNARRMVPAELDAREDAWHIDDACRCGASRRMTFTSDGTLVASTGWRRIEGVLRPEHVAADAEGPR